MLLLPVWASMLLGLLVGFLPLVGMEPMGGTKSDSDHTPNSEPLPPSADSNCSQLTLKLEFSSKVVEHGKEKVFTLVDLTLIKTFHNCFKKWGEVDNIMECPIFGPHQPCRNKFMNLFVRWRKKKVKFPVILSVAAMRTCTDRVCTVWYNKAPKKAFGKHSLRHVMKEIKLYELNTWSCCVGSAALLLSRDAFAVNCLNAEKTCFV